MTTREFTSSEGRKFVVHPIQFYDDNVPEKPVVAVTSLLVDSRIVPYLPSSLPAQSTRTPTGPGGSLSWEVKDAGPSKGFGMFATSQIQAGSLFLVEHPAIITPAKLPLSVDDHTSAYRALSDALPLHLKEELHTMANCRTMEECPTVEEGVARTNGTAIRLEFPDEIYPDEEDRETWEYGATFLKICRSNHSCGPNAGLRWDPATFSSSFYALRDIEPGEEINMIYTDITQGRADRQARLYDHYGFICACPFCSRPDDLSAQGDLIRSQLRDWPHIRPRYSKWWRDICRSDDFVIRSHLEALELLGKESMHGLQSLFVEEIMLCYAVLGDEPHFREWAEKLARLSAVQDPSLAEEVRGWLEDPAKRVNRWGWRKKQRQQAPANSDEPDFYPSGELWGQVESDEE